MLCAAKSRSSPSGLPAQLGKAAAAAYVAALASAAAPRADDVNAALPTPLWREVWAGVDATPHIWLVYSGTTIAPFSDLWSDGVRLRIAGGYGQYTYSGERRSAGSKAASYRAFHATTSFTDGLVGYLWRLGPLTAKAFAGVSAVGHAITPEDPLAAEGLKLGPKGALELWLNIGANAWASLDVSYTTAHTTYAVHSRLGYRLLPTVSVGLEGGINGSAGRSADDGTATGMLDPGHRDIRVGGFARYEWFGGEISLSGGLSGDLEGRRDAYATANWIYQF